MPASSAIDLGGLAQPIGPRVDAVAVVRDRVSLGSREHDVKLVEAAKG